MPAPRTVIVSQALSALPASTELPMSLLVQPDGNADCAAAGCDATITAATIQISRAPPCQREIEHVVSQIALEINLGGARTARTFLRANEAQ